MSIQKNNCDWVAYYKAAYEEEQKKNTQMAGHIADAERRQADLQDNLNRICSNPLYRMAVKAAAPLRRAAGRMREGFRMRRLFSGSRIPICNGLRIVKIKERALRNFPSRLRYRDFGKLPCRRRTSVF